MTRTGFAGGQERTGGAGLDVQIAQELIERARAQGVSLVGPDGLLGQATRTVLQTALDTELAEHLGYEKGDPAGRGRGSTARSGHVRRGLPTWRRSTATSWRSTNSSATTSDSPSAI